MSEIMNEKTSNLIREKRELDIFLEMFKESGSPSTLTQDVTQLKVDAESQKVTSPEQGLTSERWPLSELTLDIPPEISAEKQAIPAVTEPVSDSYGREGNVHPQDNRQDAINGELSAERDEKPVDDNAAIITAAVASAGESLPAVVSPEKEQQPETTVSDLLSLDIPILVLKEKESVPAEIHEEEEKRPETASALETAEPVPLVLEERDKQAVDFQQTVDEPGPQRIESSVLSKEEPPQILTSERLPEHALALTSEESGSAPPAIRQEEDRFPEDRTGIAEDETAKKALPAFIIRKEAVAENKTALSDIDKTLDLQKSAPIAEEQKSEPENEDREITREEEVFGKTFKAKPEKQPTRSWKRAGVLFAIFAAMSLGYFGLYPDAGQQTIRWMASNIPYFNQLVDVDRKPEVTIYQQIKFTDLKQRFIYNLPLGRTIRIVEGNAVNQAAFPVSTIKIQGELYDARGSVLASKMTFCGNILPDEKLATLGEAEIGSVSSIPQGSDLSNSKILPQNQIPFMIVFTSEPIGVVKTTVMPVSFAGVSP